MENNKFVDKRTPARELKALEKLAANVDLFTAQRGKRLRTDMLGYEDERSSEDYLNKLNKLLSLPGTRNAVLSTIDQEEAAKRHFVSGWNVITLK